MNCMIYIGKSDARENECYPMTCQKTQLLSIRHMAAVNLPEVCPSAA